LTTDISVIMPNYNKSPYIASAIESVLGQTMRDFELLVVDDASTDESARIVEEISRSDSRVSLVRQQIRKGVSHSRNVGIRLSRADIVAFLDSDDLYAPNCLEAMHRALTNSLSPAVVYSDCWLLDGSGNRLPPWPYRSCTASGMILKEFLLFGMTAEANLMLPKKLFDDIGLYNESISFGEDTDIIFRLTRKYPFVYLDERLYGYRMHADSTLNKMSVRERLAVKTPIIERYFRVNMRSLDEATRWTVRRKLIESYLEAHAYNKVFAVSASSPRLFLRSLRMVSRRFFQNAVQR